MYTDMNSPAQLKVSQFVAQMHKKGAKPEFIYTRKQLPNDTFFFYKLETGKEKGDDYRCWFIHLQYEQVKNSFRSYLTHSSIIECDSMSEAHHRYHQMLELRIAEVETQRKGGF